TGRLASQPADDDVGGHADGAAPSAAPRNACWLSSGGKAAACRLGPWLLAGRPPLIWGRQSPEANARLLWRTTATGFRGHPMGWSIKLFSVAGTAVRIHLTFFLLLAWIAALHYTRGGVEAAIDGVAFISLLFLCVVLHEFGHVFAARAYG